MIMTIDAPEESAGICPRIPMVRGWRWVSQMLTVAHSVLGCLTLAEAALGRACPLRAATGPAAVARIASVAAGRIDLLVINLKIS